MTGRSSNKNIRRADGRAGAGLFRRTAETKRQRLVCVSGALGENKGCLP